MTAINGFGVILSLFFIALPVIVLYFVVKLAIKNAVKELKEDKML